VGRPRKATLPPIPADYDRLELLYEVQTVLAQPRSIADRCDALLSIVTSALPVETAVLLDVSGELLRVFMWAAPGIESAVLEEARDHARERLDDLVRGTIPPARMVTRAAVLTGGVAERAPLPHHFVTLPLSFVRGPVFGVFQLETATAFDEHDLLFINAVANQLAVALDRHHTKQQLDYASLELEHANRRLTDLQVLSKAALEGATLDESLTAVLRSIGPMFGTDIAAVLLVSPDGSRLRRQASTGLDAPSDLEIAVGAGAAGLIAANDTAMCFDNLNDVPGVSPTLRSNGVRSLLGAPMRARNRVTGVVYVASRTLRHFGADELRFMELVAERIGAIIDNARLYAKALAAVRSRDAVMGVVSHDLRSPLSTIQMCTEMLPANDPKLTKPVSIIKRSLDVMARLIGDLRDVANIEADHLSIQIGSENASTLVRDAVEDMSEAIASKRIALDMRLPTHPIVVDCDRVRVVQVLTNLLSNAIKFTQPGGSISVAVTEEAGHGRFSVTDTGCGIAKHDLVRVFERYWQATATAHLGTGLGLAITKGIVEAHGGTMSVESTVGVGTTFAFTLRLARDQEVPHAPLAQHVVAAVVGARVLVVDDERNALLALAALLGEAGFVVETAADALRALPKVREFAPEILVVDVEMPGLNGPDFVRKVREAFTAIPVIFMTGHSDEDLATDLLELHAFYIRKPIKVDALISAINELTRGQRDSAQS
jgi:signal transduction histidine kinase/ActR/RegA family two-component response regulator